MAGSFLGKCWALSSPVPCGACSAAVRAGPDDPSDSQPPVDQVVVCLCLAVSSLSKERLKRPGIVGALLGQSARQGQEHLLAVAVEGRQALNGSSPSTINDERSLVATSASASAWSVPS